MARDASVVLAALLAALISALSAWPSPSSTPATETRTFPAAADTYLRSDQLDTNEGGSTFLQLQAGEQRALVRFETTALHSFVGRSPLISATLRLRISENANNWGANGGKVSVSRLRVGWAEGNGFSAGTSSPVRGDTEGATWACAIDPLIDNAVSDCGGVTEWAMAKTTRSSLPWVEPATASALIREGQTGTVSFDVTSDVRAFLSGTAFDEGWIISFDREDMPAQLQFGSRESGDGATLVVVIKRAPADGSGPTVSPSGPLFALAGQTIAGDRSYGLTVEASDVGSGVSRIWLEQVGDGDIANSELFCPEAPGTSCAPQESFRTTIADTTGLASGVYSFVAKAEDGAGNVGESEPWTITIDRSLTGEEGEPSADQRDWDEDLTDYGTPAAPIPVSPASLVAPGSYTTETWDASETESPHGLEVVTSTAPGTYALTGIVVDDASGEVISGAQVTLARSGGPTLTTESDSSGGFAFINVPAADKSHRVTLRVTKDGYGSHQLDRVRADPDATAQTTVFLAPYDQRWSDSYPEGHGTGS